MASATTRASFTFSLSSPSLPSTPKPKPHITFPPFHLKSHSISSFYRHPRTQFKSIDVSKEDKLISEQPISETSISEYQEPEQEEEKFDKRRLEEKFVVLNTGIYECRSCGYKYNQAVGDPTYPIPPGLPFDKLPEDWRCATCGAAKSFFDNKSVEIAGFAENQQYGLGVTAAKTTAFERLYAELKDKSGDKKLYKLVEARERRALDLDQVKCIKDEDGKVLVAEAPIR